jgi:hypothetical protein
MNQVRASKQKSRRRILILPTCLQNVPPVPRVNADVLLHGFPGGIRHEPIDIAAALRRYDFMVEQTKFGYVATNEDQTGELNTFYGETLVDLLFEVKDETPECYTLYNQVCRDPLEQTKRFVINSGFELKVEEYLFEVVPEAHRETQLTVSRIYRKLLGKSVDLVTKWAQGSRFGDGYLAFKYPVQTEQDVYHVGSSSLFDQSARSIHTTGAIRCAGPGARIEKEPPESVCVSDCSKHDEYGLSSVEYFYKFYEHWIEMGKKVYFKGDLCYPPKFPCVILGASLSRPHNREFIGYADNTMTTRPDYQSATAAMSRANAIRNVKARDGLVDYPSCDKQRVKLLLCEDVDYQLTVPKEVKLEQRVCSKARFPIAREAFGWRCKVDIAAPAFDGITNSVIVWLFERLEFIGEGEADIDLLSYPYFENHQIVDECLWSFEVCADKLGLKRVKSRLRGKVTAETRESFTRLTEKSAARH